jgi:hypothetical protein
MPSCLTFLLLPIFLILYNNIVLAVLYISFLDNSVGVQVMSHNCFVIFYSWYIFWLFWKPILRQFMHTQERRFKQNLLERYAFKYLRSQLNKMAVV